MSCSECLLKQSVPSAQEPFLQRRSCSYAAGLNGLFGKVSLVSGVTTYTYRVNLHHHFTLWWTGDKESHDFLPVSLFVILVSQECAPVSHRNPYPWPTRKVMRSDA